MFPILEAGSTLDRTDLPAFVVARDGLYLRKRSLLGLSQTKVERVAHLPTEREFVDYALPKVPADLMARVVGFFRSIYRLHHAEALVLLTWSDAGFDLVVPAQKVSGASVTFDHADGDVPIGSRLIGTIHSHGAFGAFASSIDEDDESELDGLHIVIGDFNRRRQSYSATIVVDGARFDFRTGQLIERPRRLVEPPVEWLGKVKLAPAPRSRRAKGASGGSSRLDPASGSSAIRATRSDLDGLLDRAGAMAGQLGYRLSYWLVPVSGSSHKVGETDG
jgi:hypothetical protein